MDSFFFKVEEFRLDLLERLLELDNVVNGGYLPWGVLEEEEEPEWDRGEGGW